MPKPATVHMVNGTRLFVDLDDCPEVLLAYGETPAIVVFAPALPVLMSGVRAHVPWYPVFRSIRRYRRNSVDVLFVVASPGVSRKEEFYFELSRDEFCRLLDLCRVHEATREELLRPVDYAAAEALSSPVVTEPAIEASDNLSLDEKAVGRLAKMLSRNEEPNVAQIARELDVERTYLYTLPLFKSMLDSCRAEAEARKQRRPRGSKDRSGSLEAWRKDE